MNYLDFKTSCIIRHWNQQCSQLHAYNTDINIDFQFEKGMFMHPRNSRYKCELFEDTLWVCKTVLADSWEPLCNKCFIWWLMGGYNEFSSGNATWTRFVYFNADRQPAESWRSASEAATSFSKRVMLTASISCVVSVIVCIVQFSRCSVVRTWICWNVIISWYSDAVRGWIVVCCLPIHSLDCAWFHSLLMLVHSLL